MQFSSESLACHQRLGVDVLGSSRDLGWTSLLIDLHRVRPGEAEIETRATPDLTIVAQLDGETDVESFDGGSWRRAIYQPGTLGLTPGDRVDRLRRRLRPRSRDVRKGNVYLPATLMEEAYDELRRSGQRSADSRLNALAFRDPALAQAVATLLAAIEAGAPDLYAAGAAHWLAVHLLCFHAGRIEPERIALATGAISDRRIANVLDLMSTRFADPLSLADLAAEAGVSRFHFVRLFRRKTGSTPFALLRRLRLQAARTHLATTDLDIGPIATLCGFARGAELARAFASEYGVSPGAWRSMASGRSGAEAPEQAAKRGG